MFCDSGSKAEAVAMVVPVAIFSAKEQLEWDSSDSEYPETQRSEKDLGAQTEFCV